MFRLLSLLMVFSLGGCAFSAVDRVPIEKYKKQVTGKIFPNLSQSEALDIAAVTLRSIGYEVATTTPELAEVRSGNKAAMVPVACDCGSWNGNQVTGNADSMFAVRVENPGTETTGVKINFVCAVKFTGQNLWGATTRAESYQCASTGVIENQFWENFEKISAARKK